MVIEFQIGDLARAFYTSISRRLYLEAAYAIRSTSGREFWAEHSSIQRG